MDRIYIFDTTLRDGEQSPGCSMTIEQKYEMAVQLSRLGVDIIEAGFPISSPHQFEAVELISKRVKGPVIAGLARAVEKDIDRAAEALKHAETSRIHTFLATSPIHMKHKLNKTEDEVVEMAVKAVRYARSKVAQVEFSPEDGTRSHPDFLCRIIEKVIDAGALTINIPDTVGYSTPQEIFRLIQDLRNRVPNIDKAVLSIHCHNDLGLAVANSLAALEAGARQAEVTINGIGERAGNSALEELIMALDVRRDHFQLTSKIDTHQIYHTSKLLSSLIGFPIPRNKPIVGENAFAHESGIHQDGMLKHRSTYEIMTPESVGREASSIVLGRHSGLHGLKSRLTELGLALSEEELKKTYDQFVLLADKKKQVYDEDLYILVGKELGKETEQIHLDYFSVFSGNSTIPTASVRLKKDSQIFEEASTGDGPIDALFLAIQKAAGLKAEVHDYTVQAVTPGQSALGEASVTLDIEGFRFTGRGNSTDTFEASALAYVSALNKFLNQKASLIGGGQP